jgi:hypothetical protein
MGGRCIDACCTLERPEEARGEKLGDCVYWHPYLHELAAPGPEDL